MLPDLEYICMEKIIILWSVCESWGGKRPSCPPCSAFPVNKLTISLVLWYIQYEVYTVATVVCNASLQPPNTECLLKVN